MRRSRRYVRHSVFMPMDRGHLAKRENTPTYRSCGDRLAGTKTKSALNLEVLSLDWQTICEAGTGECHYQVRLEGKWWHVTADCSCAIWQSCGSGAGLACILSGP